jgi:hypothetical protein
MHVMHNLKITKTKRRRRAARRGGTEAHKIEQASMLPSCLFIYVVAAAKGRYSRPSPDDTYCTFYPRVRNRQYVCG